MLEMNTYGQARLAATSLTDPVLGASWKIASRLINLDPDVDRWLSTGLGIDPEV